ncbi:MAG: hypothetical protein H0X66_10230 [Verrucomicrobia bacterium]|nr:hypothetical protein [Verrucomicrobiota bacterium]
MGKSIRFSELVKTSGKPQVTTLWSDPKDDPGFAKAMEENRILTVAQETVGNKKDFGQIGFKRDKNVSYLIFPKPLPETSDARVIGIKYDLTEQPIVADPISKSKRATSKSEKKAVARRPIPAQQLEKKYTATVRKTAVWELTITVTAKTKAEAERIAESTVQKQSIPTSEAVLKTEVRSIEESD